MDVVALLKGECGGRPLLKKGLPLAPPFQKLQIYWRLLSVAARCYPTRE